MTPAGTQLEFEALILVSVVCLSAGLWQWGMEDQMSGYDAARLAAIACFVVSAMIAVAVATPATDLDSQQIAWLVVVQAGINALMLWLPRVQGDGQTRVTTRRS